MPESRNVSTIFLIYSELAYCIRSCIRYLNNASAEAVRTSLKTRENCVLCHDTLETKKGSVLTTIVLSYRHRFHEVYVIQWLSCIKLPPTEPLPQ